MGYIYAIVCDIVLLFNRQQFIATVDAHNRIYNVAD